MSKKRPMNFNLCGVQNDILSMLQRGGHLRKDKDNDFRLANAVDESVPINAADYLKVWKLINGSYIKKEKVTREEVIIYRITDKGTALLLQQDHEVEVRLKV